MCVYLCNDYLRCVKDNTKRSKTRSIILKQDKSIVKNNISDLTIMAEISI